MLDHSFQWIPFLIFAFVQSATPGPNVVMLTSSGSTWGFKQSFPHLLGVCFGFPLMFLIVQFGAGRVFHQFPWLFPVLTLLSLIYVLWLAIRIFKMGFNGDLKVTASSRPMTFLEALLFQWVNGKAWQIVLMAATLYPSGDAKTKILGALSFLGILFFCGSFWIELGKRIAGYLQNSYLRKSYYALLAVSLLLSTFPTGINQLASQSHVFMPKEQR